MNNIIYDDNIITPENNKWGYYYNFIKKLNGKDCVKFALFCAKIVNNNSKKSLHCIALIEKWLKDGNSVSKQELYDAASVADTYYVSTAAYAAFSTYYAINAASYTAYTTYAAYYASYSADYVAANTVNAASCDTTITNDLNLYLKTLLRTTKQYNTKIHNNQHYEFILKQIIKENIDKLTDTDYNMLIDLSQEYYNINPNIINKRIFVELLRREYE